MKNTWSKRVISIDPKDIKYDRDGQVKDVKIDPSGVIDLDRLPTQRELKVEEAQKILERIGKRKLKIQRAKERKMLKKLEREAKWKESYRLRYKRFRKITLEQEQG